MRNAKLKIGALIFALSLLSACSEESPTGPEPDPLVGRWLGTFISPVSGNSEANSLSITVQAGGDAVGTARYFYQYQQNHILEVLFLEITVTPDGQVSGSGSWYLEIIDVGYYYGEGEVSGSLDPDHLTGSGLLLIEEEEGYLSVNWEVTKDGTG